MKGSYTTKLHFFQINFYQISSLHTEADTVQTAFPKSVKGSYITKLHLFKINFYQISSLLTEKDTVQIMF